MTQALRRPNRSAPEPAPAPVEPPPRRVQAAAARNRAAVSVTPKATITVREREEEEVTREVFLPRCDFAPGEHPGELRMSGGKTISLGVNSYEFLRIDVSLMMPTMVDDLEATRDFMSEFVADTLLDEENKWFAPPPPRPQAKRRG